MRLGRSEKQKYERYGEPSNTPYGRRLRSSAEFKTFSSFPVRLWVTLRTVHRLEEDYAAVACLNSFPQHHILSGKQWLPQNTSSISVRSGEDILKERHTWVLPAWPQLSPQAMSWHTLTVCHLQGRALALHSGVTLFLSGMAPGLP